MTPGQLSRAERDYAIAAAAEKGCSERMLSRVFKLPRSRIHTIIAGVRALHEELQSHRNHAVPSYREAFKLHGDGRKRERPKPEG